MPRIVVHTRANQEPAACRTYDYMGEAACDARLMTFLTCVQAVRDQTPGGFAAVKLTALGDPVLLSQITTCAHVRFCLLSGGARRETVVQEEVDS